MSSYEHRGLKNSTNHSPLHQGARVICQRVLLQPLLVQVSVPSSTGAACIGVYDDGRIDDAEGFNPLFIGAPPSSSSRQPDYYPTTCVGLRESEAHACDS